jgi:hypothetical protein
LNFIKGFEWERAALRELYREYEWFLRVKRLKLRPAAIVLMDSKTQWGRWERETRTLSLSRVLVKDFAWHHVLGILRHEIAHQWVDEALPLTVDVSKLDPSPHGERFRLACEKLGVPALYSGAKADLQEFDLDWRKAQDSSEESQVGERLLERTKKLLALATSSNEHEALAAMEKVREIYAKHHLDQYQREQKDKYCHLVICGKKKRFEIHQSKIISILVGHFFVKVLTVPQYDVETGQEYRAIELIGTRENCLMAEYVYHFLLNQLDFWVKQAARERRQMTRLQRKSFRMGILSGFSEKLEGAKKATPSEVLMDSWEVKSDSPRASRSTSLTWVGKAIEKFEKDRSLDDYMKSVYPQIVTRSGSSYGVDSSVFARGKEIGLKLTLKKGVSARQGNLGRLLPTS